MSAPAHPSRKHTEHRHSGAGLLTPAMVHYGQAENILRQRQEVLDVAYQRHPERFVRSAPRPPVVPTEAWINKPVIFRQRNAKGNSGDGIAHPRKQHSVVRVHPI
jgi:hypothetical protein